MAGKEALRKSLKRADVTETIQTFQNGGTKEGRPSIFLFVIGLMDRESFKEYGLHLMYYSTDPQEEEYNTFNKLVNVVWDNAEIYDIIRSYNPKTGLVVNYVNSLDY